MQGLGALLMKNNKEMVLEQFSFNLHKDHVKYKVWEPYL